MAQAYNNLAEAVRNLGSEPRALELYEQSLNLAREMGDRLGVAVALENLATLAHRLGNRNQSRLQFADALLLYRTVGDWIGVAACLVGVAVLRAEEGFAEGAVQLLGAATSLQDKHEAGELMSEFATNVLETNRLQLGDQAFLTSWTQGQAMSLDAAIQEATTTIATGYGGKDLQISSR
jgi:tetratricopeptide (TPR) repeat protein